MIHTIEARFQEKEQNHAKPLDARLETGTMLHLLLVKGSHRSGEIQAVGNEMLPFMQGATNSTLDRGLDTGRD